MSTYNPKNIWIIKIHKIYTFLFHFHFLRELHMESL
jgi:hypothetical protein